MECKACDDTGHVCENHPDRPWGELSDATNACSCGAGIPCARCRDETFNPKKAK